MNVYEEKALQLAKMAEPFIALLQKHNEFDERGQPNADDKIVFAINAAKITLGDLRELRVAVARVKTAGMYAEVGDDLPAGTSYGAGVTDNHTFGINIGEHTNKIEVYDSDPVIGARLRDRIIMLLNGGKEP